MSINMLFGLIAAIGIALAAFGLASKDRTVENRLISFGDEEQSEEIAELTILQAFFLDVSSRIMPEHNDGLENKLLRSGYFYSSAAEFHVKRMVYALVFMAVGIFFGVVANLGLIGTSILATGLAILGFFNPSQALNDAIKNRRIILLREMGFGLEKIALHLSSGAHIAQALAKAGDVGSFGDICKYLAANIQTNRDVPQAIEEVLTAYPKSAELNEFCDMVLTSYRQGQNVTEIFRGGARRLRDRLYRDIRYAGEKAKLQVTLITSGIIMVSSMIIVIGTVIQTLLGDNMF